VPHGVCYPLSHTFGVVKFKTRMKVEIVQEKRNILSVKVSHFNSGVSAGNGECILLMLFSFPLWP
jgi:hypothetical protein